MTNDNIQYFVKESQFEQALVDLLPHHGWEKEVLIQPTEEDLIQNWAKILFDNNRDINKLGNYPLTASEMRQIIDQVNLCDSPYAMNMFINGGQVCIKRDNPADTNNYGKEVYLKILMHAKSVLGRAATRLPVNLVSRLHTRWAVTDGAM